MRLALVGHHLLSQYEMETWKRCTSVLSQAKPMNSMHVKKLLIQSITIYQHYISLLHVRQCILHRYEFDSSGTLMILRLCQPIKPRSRHSSPRTAPKKRCVVEEVANPTTRPAFLYESTRLLPLGQSVLQGGISLGALHRPHNSFSPAILRPAQWPS
jgi:putative component of membrane protein insertase Oxa1/YidC/SpoIIIJ protein YidD